MKNILNKVGVSALTSAFFFAAAPEAVQADPSVVATYKNHTVDANGNRYYDTYLYADEITAIELDGDCYYDSQDIDLWVYDENGNKVGSSTGQGCYEAVYVEPRWDGWFKVRVENQGKPFDTDYTLEIY